MNSFDQKTTIAYFVDDVSTSFVINDIIAFSKQYKHIFLFSVDEIEDRQELPENVVLIDGFMDWNAFNKWGILTAHFKSIIKLYLKECFFSKKVLPVKKSIAILASNIFKSEALQKQIELRKINITDISFFYSFWFYDCIYLAWFKQLYPYIKLICRAHSGDLYEDHISIRNNILFRHFQMQELDAVYPVSKMGTAYLKNRYPKFSDKITTQYLGTDDYKCLNPFSKEQFVVVSCASFRHHKRIHKIAEALLAVEKDVIWYHFGDENLTGNDPKIQEYIERKQQLEQNKNITFKPMGLTSNRDLMRFYSKTPVNLFVSLSAVEGIPVSIMEAIAFGIPVLSTDVGGCSEIVNDFTGILIPLKTEISEVSKILNEFPDSNKNTLNFRQNVRLFWQTQFDANQNYLDFFKKVNTKS